MMNMDEGTLIARANEEREKLFQRYDRGREQGAEIDSWEDPGFEVYHQTDRYGFIHDKRLPQRLDPNESKAKSIEMERVKKWLKMLKHWESRDTKDKLKRRVYKGIPDKLRPRVWVKLLDIEKIMDENKDVYQRMLKLARQWSTEARQIDSDVNRQFREHLFYRERYSIKQKSLFNVLTAYSMYNMEVGYCQGMSGLAGVLLMYMNEEEAFWALSTLLSNKKYAMHGLYIEGFPKLQRFLAHHDKIIEKFLPKLKKHFDQFNLDSILYSLKWFFVVFVERIPFNLCLRVWDIYLLDGERVVTAMAYTILKLHKTKILKLKDMDLIVQYVQAKMHKDFGYNDDYVIKALEASMDELKKAKLELPPPGGENEFPKRPFGVFREPSLDAKLGLRKTIFTDTEKQVTDNVILRREITAQEMAEARLVNGVTCDGSSVQLNTGNIPESEDGCSLLGSSRKSLADTSVTSTADLSIFSGGQRSQQAYEICTEDMRSIQSEGEGESSPGSAFCSLSVVGRTPSAMMITPTPRAISPQDIVRIYVPPPSSDEIIKDKRMSGGGGGDTNDRDKRNTIVAENNIVTTPLPSNQLKRRNSQSMRSDEDMRDLHSSFETLNGGGGCEIDYKMYTTNRRGSLSGKSPLIFDNKEMLPECAHMRNHKNSGSISDSMNDLNKIKLNISTLDHTNTNSSSSSVSQKLGNVPKKMMTSFEELAINKSKSSNSIILNERMIKSDIVDYSSYPSPSSPSSNGTLKCFTSTASYSTKPIKLTNRNDSIEIDADRKHTHHHHHHQHQHVATTDDDDDYDTNDLNNTNIKYKALSSSIGSDSSELIISNNNINNKFYNSNNYSNNTNNRQQQPQHIKSNIIYNSTEDDEIYKILNKSSDESSSSPNSKSVLTTPVNETIPLLATINSYNTNNGGRKFIDNNVGTNRNEFNNISSSSGSSQFNTTAASAAPSSSSLNLRKNLDSNKIRIQISRKDN